MEEIIGVKCRILFVCLGNICRSPAAEAVFRALVEAEGLSEVIAIDSAGLNGYHDGESADSRMMRRASARGYVLTSISRRVVEDDYRNFDIIIGMDANNIERLRSLAPDEVSQKKVHLMTQYCRNMNATCVPDPYYGDTDGFNLVLDILEDSCAGLLEEVKKGL